MTWNLKVLLTRNSVENRSRLYDKRLMASFSYYLLCSSRECQGGKDIKVILDKYIAFFFYIKTFTRVNIKFTITSHIST